MSSQATCAAVGKLENNAVVRGSFDPGTEFQQSWGHSGQELVPITGSPSTIEGFSELADQDSIVTRSRGTVAMRFSFGLRMQVWQYNRPTSIGVARVIKAEPVTDRIGERIPQFSTSCIGWMRVVGQNFAAGSLHHPRKDDVNFESARVRVRSHMDRGPQARWDAREGGLKKKCKDVAK